MQQPGVGHFKPHEVFAVLQLNNKRGVSWRTRNL